MDDLMMTELCAQAMGVALMGSDVPLWNPLKDDAQAMALVKKFMLEVDAFSNCVDLPALRDPKGIYTTYSDESLNRAIVECIAKMQFDRMEREAVATA